MRVATILMMLWAVTAGAGAQDGAGAIEIRGLTSIDEAEARQVIANQVKAIETHGASGARADDAAFFLQMGLRERGYAQSQVRWDVMEGGRVVLTVDEGVPLQLGAVDVRGNEVLEDAAVVELLTKPTRERLFLPPGETVPYVASEIEGGLGAVRRFYGLLGYVEAEVELVDERTADGAVELTVDVREGHPHRVGEVSLPEPPDEALAVAFDSIREELQGKPYSPAVPGIIAGKLEKAAADAGYVDVVAEALEGEHRRVDGTDYVDLSATAEWGERYRLARVEVSGNEEIKTRFFERMFDDLVGETYSPDAVGEVVNEILETGAFEAVLLNPEPVGEAGAKDLVLGLEVQEAPTRNVGVGLGLGTYEGAIFGLDFRDVGRFGLAKVFSSELEYTQRGIRGEVGYHDPWFLWSDWKLDAGLFSLTRDNEGYAKFEAGATLQFTREFGDAGNQALSLFVQPSYTTITDSEIDDLFLGQDSYFNSYVGISYAYDTRDEPHYPRAGVIFETTLGLASALTGSEIEYLRSTVRLGYYRPVWKGTLRLNGRAGIVSPTGDAADFPIDLRFFNGGARSVRSFRERELGPQDGSGYPVGGEFYTVFNAEYDIPVFGELSVVPFFDAGNLLPDAGDAGLDDLHYAGGLGIRLKTPIGPLRIDYGHNLNRGVGEPSGSWHVGFGVAF